MSWAELSSALINTVIVATGVFTLCVPLALFLSIALVRTNVIAARWAWIALFSQLIVPLYAQVGAWSAGFGTQGWWPLSQTAVVGHRVAGCAVVSFIHAMAALPGAVLILSLGLVWVSRSREELALVEGGRRHALRQVMLPALRGWIAAAALWAMLPVLTEMVVTNLYQLPTLPEQVYLDISLGTDSGLTYAVSIALCMCPLLIMALALRQQLPSLSTMAEHVSQHPPQRLRLGRARWIVSMIVWSMILAIVGVPLLNLLIKAGWQSSLSAGGQMQHQWSSQRLLRTLVETSTLFISEFSWTATLAGASATLSMLIAFCMRWYTLHRHKKIRLAMDCLCIALIAMPGPLVASLVTWLFLRTSLPLMSWLYDHSLCAPILAQQTRLLPLAWLMVGGILSSVGKQGWELSQLDQLSGWMRWKTLIWPSTWRHWLVAWLLLGALAAGELSTHLLLLPPGVTTVAQRLFEFLHFGMRYQDSGLCLALVAFGWLVAITVWNTRTGRV